MDRLADHLEKLGPFTTIAELGSLHRAANRLHTSQPALTQMLKSMESHLEVQLFARTSRGMTLTDAGEKLYKFAKTVLRQTSEFHFSGETGTSSVRIATYESIVDLICRRLQDLPTAQNYQFSCHVSGLKLIDLLVAGETDYIVLAEPPKVRGVRFEKLLEARYGLFATEQFLAQRKIAGLETLQQEPLIFVPGSVSSSTGIIDRFIAATGLGQGQRLTVNSYVAAKTLTLGHHGIGILVDALAAEEMRTKKLIEIEMPSTPQKVVTSLYLGLREGQEGRSPYPQVKQAILAALNVN